MEELSSVGHDEAPSHALRIIVTAKGRDVADLKVQRARMIVPPSDTTYGLKAKCGYWFELRDERGKVLYRRILSEPVDSVEAPSGDPERSLMRATVEDREQVIVLLVPDLERARSLNYCASPHGDPKDLWSFEMDDLRKRGAN